MGWEVAERRGWEEDRAEVSPATAKPVRASWVRMESREVEGGA